MVWTCSSYVKSRIRYRMLAEQLLGIPIMRPGDNIKIDVGEICCEVVN